MDFNIQYISEWFHSSSNWAYQAKIEAGESQSFRCCLCFWFETSSFIVKSSEFLTGRQCGINPKTNLGQVMSRINQCLFVYWTLRCAFWSLLVVFSGRRFLGWWDHTTLRTIQETFIAPHRYGFFDRGFWNSVFVWRSNVRPRTRTEIKTLLSLNGGKLASIETPVYF